MSISPSNEEMYAKLHALSDNPRRITENPVKVAPVFSMESPSMPIKVIVSPSKKNQPSSVPATHQSLKNPPQSFVSQQLQHTKMVIYYYFYYLNIVLIILG